MKKFLEYFKLIKWYEYIMFFVFLATTVALGIVFHSSALVICNSIFLIIAVFLLAKGFILGNIFEIVSLVLYCFIAYNNRYYGEIIINGGIMTIAYLINLFAWIKNRHKYTGVVKISKGIIWKEFLPLASIFICSGVGVYFLLRAFNTANLVASTISVVCGFFAVYFMIRRNIFNYVFYILSNIVCIWLWAKVVIDGGLDFLPTLVNYVILILLNLYGMVNWLRLQKTQSKIEINKNKEEIITKEEKN